MRIEFSKKNLHARRENVLHQTNSAKFLRRQDERFRLTSRFERNMRARSTRLSDLQGAARKGKEGKEKKSSTKRVAGASTPREPLVARQASQEVGVTTGCWPESVAIQAHPARYVSCCARQQETSWAGRSVLLVKRHNKRRILWSDHHRRGSGR